LWPLRLDGYGAGQSGTRIATVGTGDRQSLQLSYIEAMDLSVGMLVIFSVVIVSVMAFSNRVLLDRLILVPSRVARRRELYRLLTAGWVHGDATHLIFNMLSLYFFAPFVERALGTTQFLLLYFSAVIVGFVPTVVRHRSRSNYRSLGASGAVSAVIFSAIVINPELRMYLMFIPIAVPGWLFAIAYLAYSAYSSHRGGDNINHDAHFAGALYGVALTVGLAPRLAESGLRGLLG
jgi:membrane associated rhomboid family serine protease